MKKKENYLFSSLAMLTFIICLSTMVKGNKPKDAKCKQANQTCYIISKGGTETSKSGMLTVD